MKIIHKITISLNILMLVVFLPVLFCVLFIGNHMNYFETMKLQILVPTIILTILALIGTAFCISLLFFIHEKRFDRKANTICNLTLLILFCILYFVNLRVARDIAFKIPWDINVVCSLATNYAYNQPLGDHAYLSMYSNNIPITYLLGTILKNTDKLNNYPYESTFIWIQINCILLSLSGYFCCLTIKKLTKKILPTILTFIIYLSLIGVSPWKIAPYTDTYGIFFPIISLYLYVCYMTTSKTSLKYLYIVLALIGGMAGGFIKPSIYISVIAIIMTECIYAISDIKNKWHFLLAEIILLVIITFCSNSAKDYMIQKINLDFNPEIEESWHHYFMMGLNEETTGGYYSNDVGIMIGQYQDSKLDRNKAEIEIAISRLHDRGVVGTFYFWLRKMVMTFNDGTFGWRSEVWISDYYSADLATNTKLTTFLRNIFWPDATRMGGYNTLCQLAWFICLLGIPGIILGNKEQRSKYLILSLYFLGFFFYQMFFEARARYLFVCLPIVIILSVCGMQNYVFRLKYFYLKRLSKKQ